MWVKSVSNLNFSNKLLEQLLQSQNLGKALRNLCNVLTVNVLRQNLGRPLAEEMQLLGLNILSKKCFIREVILEGDGLPFCRARVVAPNQVYIKYKNELDSLGNKLIGETFLYNKPTTTRTHFEYSCIQSDNYPKLKKMPETPESFQWARRSIFYLEGTHPLLITEIFLNALFKRL